MPCRGNTAMHLFSSGEWQDISASGGGGGAASVIDRGRPEGLRVRPPRRTHRRHRRGRGAILAARRIGRRTSLSTPEPIKSSACPSRSPLRRRSPSAIPVERDSGFESTTLSHAPTAPPCAFTRAKRKEAHIVARDVSDWRLGNKPVYKLDPQCPREVAT